MEHSWPISSRLDLGVVKAIRRALDDNLLEAEECSRLIAIYVEIPKSDRGDVQDCASAIVECFGRLATARSDFYSLWPTYRDRYYVVNPFPCVLGDDHSWSWHQLAMDLVYGWLLLEVKHEVESTCGSMGRMLEEPEPTHEQVVKCHTAFRKVAVFGADVPWGLLWEHLDKEMFRLTGCTDGIDSKDNGHRLGNAERDQWMYEQRLAGETVAAIRFRLSQEHPEWEQVDTVQAVSMAVKRYATRYRLPVPRVANSSE